MSRVKVSFPFLVFQYFLSFKLVSVIPLHFLLLPSVSLQIQDEIPFLFLSQERFLWCLNLPISFFFLCSFFPRVRNVMSHFSDCLQWILSLTLLGDTDRSCNSSSFIIARNCFFGVTVYSFLYCNLTCLVSCGVTFLFHTSFLSFLLLSFLTSSLLRERSSF